LPAETHKNIKKAGEFDKKYHSAERRNLFAAKKHRQSPVQKKRPIWGVLII
jgi:hypothetical protein